MPIYSITKRRWASEVHNSTTSQPACFLIHYNKISPNTIAVIYAGYFFGQYPCGWLIGRFPAQRVVGVSCLLWGVMVLVLTACRRYQSALAVRFIMGIFEAAVTPGLTLMTGFWYTRREIPLRQCIWYSSLGWGGIVGSYVSMGVSKLPADMKPQRWELIFFIVRLYFPFHG